MKTGEQLSLADGHSFQDHRDSVLASVKMRKKRGEWYPYAFGLVSGLCISLIVALFLYTGNPNPVENDSVIRPRPPSQGVQSVLFQQIMIAESQWLSTDDHKTEQSDVEIQAQTVISPAGYGSQNLTDAMSCSITESDRFDCWPEIVGTKEQCLARGCCWIPATLNAVPYCFYPTNYTTYTVNSSSSSSTGMSAKLVMERPSPYPHDVQELRVDVTYLSDHTMRFKIFDPQNSRYEVPMNLSISGNPPQETDYRVTLQRRPFGILVIRRSTGAILFDSRNLAPLMFADQYLQTATRLSTPNIYGLGEHQGPLRLDINWQRLVIWNRAEPPDNLGNLYGAHPFYLNLESDGNAHGVFLFSSNAIEVALQPYGGGDGALTYRVLGGVLDFYVFSGPSPVEVVEQYVSLIGKPTMPPFWSLGFHLCKYGYGSTKNLSEVIERNRAINIPYDVQWNDIDYMDAFKDWTYDSNGSYKGLDKLVDDLHSHNQRYIMIIDPGISSVQPQGTYPPYDEGVKMDVFIKNATGQILIGKVWPGLTAYPDFFHPNASEYWYTQMKNYHDLIKYDGIWLDMNEVANFFNGSDVGCTEGTLDLPPYLPPGIVDKSLYARTMCPSAKQYLSTNYNLHSMYGWSEMRATRHGLTKLLRKRSFILSRSTFSGSGYYGAHWTGDNESQWPDMYFSIASILLFNMFGIPMAGADICGFKEDTTRELCIRWMQLGSFYPFMRNHNSVKATKPQDPASFDKEAQDYMRTALETRYSLLPYMYTWHFFSHTTGTPVIRPVFMLFPNPETFALDKQFMWGDGLLISPNLQEDVTYMDVYFPPGSWYDLYNGSLVVYTKSGQHLGLDAPLSTINVHVRGGSIIPRLPPAVTTNEMRTRPFFLQVAPDEQSFAQGQLYWDDGESLDSVELKKYSLLRFTLNGTTLKNEVVEGNFPGMKLDAIQVFGVPSQPKSVTLNGTTAVKFSYDVSTKVLSMTSLNIDLLTLFEIHWTL